MKKSSNDPELQEWLDALKNINQINESKINEIIEFINDDLISHITGHNRFYAFVARNSLQIIKREINLINSYEEKEIIRLEKLLNEKDYLNEILSEGCKIANKTASKKIEKLHNIIGF